MDLIITEQIFSSVLWMSTAGKESLTKGEVLEITLDEFMKWMNELQEPWVVDYTDADTIIIVRRNQVGIITHRTTIACDPQDYDELNAALSRSPSVTISSEAS
jgi:hypothetical protein